MSEDERYEVLSMMTAEQIQARSLRRLNGMVRAEQASPPAESVYVSVAALRALIQQWERDEQRCIARRDQLVAAGKPDLAVKWDQEAGTIADHIDDLKRLCPLGVSQPELEQP